MTMNGLMCFVGIVLMFLSVGSIEQETMELWKAASLGFLASALALYGALGLNEEYEGN